MLLPACPLHPFTTYIHVGRLRLPPLSAGIPTVNMDVLDVSNFDPNAILRGAQLTLVGGRLAPAHGLLNADHGAKSTAPSRTRPSSRRTTTARQQSLSPRALPSASWLLFLCVARLAASPLQHEHD